jgi:hypothetical protein
MPVTLITPGSLLPVGVFKDTPSSDLQTRTPMDIIMEYIQRKLPRFETMDDRVLVLKAPTGAGKSSVMAEAYYRFYNTLNRRQIYGVQPRVTNAINIVEELTDIPKYASSLIKFETIGYVTGPFKLGVRGLNLITSGSLSMKLRLNDDQSIIEQMSIIMIDEAHERSIDTDQLFYYVKQLLLRNIGNPNTPYLIVMSATFKEKDIARYLNSTSFGELIGSQYPIENNFAKARPQNYLTSISDQVVEILKPYQEGKKEFTGMDDVIIFLPGMKEITSLIRFINTCKEITIPVAALPFSSDIASEHGDDFFNAIERDANKINATNTTGKAKIKLIISTSAIETGVTISTLKYCIDYGRNRKSNFFPRYNANIMYDHPASQDVIMQRRGRVGRKQTGIWYPQYIEKDFLLLDEQLSPDILISDVSSQLLSLGLSSVGIVNFEFNEETKEQVRRPYNFKDIDTLSKLNPELLEYYMQKFYTLGFIDINCFTPLGYLVSRFAMTPLESAKTILSAYVFNISPIIIIELMAILEMMTMKGGAIFTKQASRDKETFTINYSKLFLGGIPEEYIDEPKIFHKEPHKFINKYRIELSDELIEMYFIYRKITEVHKKLMPKFTKFDKWCDKYGIDVEAYYRYNDTRNRILMEVDKVGFNPYETYIQPDLTSFIRNIKLCIFEGFKHNLCTLNNGVYMRRNGDIISIYPKYFNKYEDYRPRGVLPLVLNMKKIGNDEIFKVEGSIISTLDGYIYFD